MVVTNKPSANLTPMPTASRTNSSTNPPKSTKKPTTTSVSKQTHTVPISPNAALVPGKGEPKGPEFSDDVQFVPSPEKRLSIVKQDPLKAKPKPKSKAKGKSATATDQKVKRKSSTSISHWIVRISMVIFTIYSLSICPSDTNLEDPICYGISRYKDFISPYVTPPLDAILSHPMVAPQLARAQVHAQHALVVSRPYARMASKQWSIHVTPRIQVLANRSKPYIKQFQYEYRKRIAPYARVASYNITRYKQMASPYVARFWKTVEPSLTMVWNSSMTWVGKAIVRPIGEARERWVDPHVRRIVEKLEEVGENKKRKFEATASETQEALTQTQLHSSVVSVESPVTFYSTATAEPTAVDSSEGAPLAEPIGILAAAMEHPADTAPLEDDLDAFLAEISEEEISEEVGSPEAAPSDFPKEETEEEKEERLRLKAIVTAEKRADITGRHLKWEILLEELGRNETKALIEKLTLYREEKAEELRTSPTIRGFVQSLDNDAQKSLKHMDAYLKKLLGEKRGGAEKVALWDSVIEKVQKKYDEKVRAIEKYLQDWWQASLEAEAEMTEASIFLVDNMAGDAQVDIGFDYVWLDDVSTDDWTRYHDLKRMSAAISDEYRQIFNGTYPNVPSNPLFPELHTLQNEVQEVILGFETGLGKIRRKGYRIFSGGAVGQEPPEEHTKPTDSPSPEISILPITEDAIPESGEPLVVVGRGKEEVEEAIRMAEAAKVNEAKQKPYDHPIQPEDDAQGGPIVHHVEL